MDERWAEIDAYLERAMLEPDPALADALAASDAGGLPSIAVSAVQGAFLQVLAFGVGARRILEIGTLGGYSTIWLARAIPNDGRLVTLETSPRHAEVARANLDRAGVLDRVEIRVGPALETLPKLRGEPPFDLTFIDADKASTADYFTWAVDLSRPGAVIVVDNVVRRGDVLDASSDDDAVTGMRRFFERLSSERRVRASAMQTVGAKGHDGFAIAVVTR